MKGKKNWACLLLMLSGLVLGGFLGQLTAAMPFLSWLNYGQSFGLDSPIVLNLGILILTFGLTIRISIAGIVGIIVGIIIYKNL